MGAKRGVFFVCFVSSLKMGEKNILSVQSRFNWGCGSVKRVHKVRGTRDE